MKSWSSRLMAAAVGLAVLVLFIAGTSESTHAAWGSRVDLLDPEAPETVVGAGNAEMAIEPPLGLDTSSLYPGQTVSAPFSVTNTGTLPLGLRVDALTVPAVQSSPEQQAFADSLTVQVWPGNVAGCTDAFPEDAWSGSVPATPGDLRITVDPDAEQPMCLAVTMNPDAPSEAQGAQIDLQLTVGGVPQ